MSVWWQQWPERFEFEISALEALGFEYSLNDYEGEGQLEIQVKYQTNEHDFLVLARFPAEYPYFPVHMWSEGLQLGRHQDPVDGHLCTLHDAGNAWRPDLDTLASMIRDQLPSVLRSAAEPDSEFAAEHEFHQGEPITSYLQYEPGSFMAVGDFDIPDTANSGKAAFVLSSGTRPVRGAVVELVDESSGNVLIPDEWIQRAFRKEGAKEFPGRWRRISSEVNLHDPEAVFEAVFGKKSAQMTASSLPRIAVAVIQDELTWRQSGESWVIAFLPPTKVKKGLPRAKPFLVRADRCGDRELLARIPNLAALREKRVVVVGLGMLGAPCALQLARSGIGKITLVDPDTVDASTIVRWAVGWNAVGYSKAFVLDGYIKQNYPYCESEGLPYRVGMPAVNDATREFGTNFHEAIENADLVLDAAAEITVSNYLSAECRRLEKPHVVVTTTPGTLGGIVLRADWPATGCWSCAKHYQYEGDELVKAGNADEALLYSPNFLDAPGIQPAGCRVPTVIGNGFDSDWVATLAVRSVVATLCRDDRTGYPETEYDGIVVNIREPDAAISEPFFKPFNLPKHQDCVCNS